MVGVSGDVQRLEPGGRVRKLVMAGLSDGVSRWLALSSRILKLTTTERIGPWLGGRTQRFEARWSSVAALCVCVRLPACECSIGLQW